MKNTDKNKVEELDDLNHFIKKRVLKVMPLMSLRACCLLPVVCCLLFISSCKKDAAVQATFTLNIYPLVGTALVNGSPNYFLVGNPYYNAQGYKYNCSTFKYYVSNLSLIKADNTLQNVNRISLVDYSTLYIGQPAVITGNVPSGNYKGVKFWIGVDSSLNNKGPLEDYAATDPLSINQGTYWDWNTGYRFAIIEGTVDSIKDNPNPGLSGRTFLYHIGSNPLYTEVDLPPASINVAPYKSTTYNINLDVNHVFYATGDTINMYKQFDTQTTDNFPLAQQVINNMAKSFSPQ